MTQKISQRLLWAVETLAVQADDLILEIGCGHGIAVSLVCKMLTSGTGTVTAIDRSQTMIDMATKRNQSYVAAGKASFRCAALEEADFGKERFNKIFAIRVNFFIQQPTRQLAILKQLLTPGGALYLFYDPPIATQTPPFVNDATQSLQAHGFAVKEVLSKELQAVQGVCIVAEVV